MRRTTVSAGPGVRPARVEEKMYVQDPGKYVRWKSRFVPGKIAGSARLFFCNIFFVNFLYT